MAETSEEGQARPDGDDRTFIHVAHVRELAHALHNGFVVHARDCVGAQGLHAVDVLHDGARVACAHLVLARTVDTDLPPGQRDGGHQQQEGPQCDDAGRGVEPDRECAEHGGQHRALNDLARSMGEYLLVVIDIGRERLQVLAARSLGEAGERNALDGLTHDDPQITADTCAAHLPAHVSEAVHGEARGEHDDERCGDPQQDSRIDRIREDLAHHQPDQHDVRPAQHALDDCARARDAEVPVLGERGRFHGGRN